MRFHVHNFGCRATQADGAAIERQLELQGAAPASNADSADVVIFNTCTVTADADKDARAAIRRAHRDNPDARILVTGCYAQRAPHELASLPGVTWVVGNSHKHEIARIIDAAGGSLASVSSDCHPERGLSTAKTESRDPYPHHALSLRNSVEVRESSRVRTEHRDGRVEGPAFSGTSDFVPLSSLGSIHPITQSPDHTILVGDIFAHTQLLAAPVFDAPHERTRPNLKVQDGCNNRCSFCVIPYTRGRSRSLPMDEVVREANQLVAAGYQELVISGINLGRWGRDLDTTNAAARDRFPDLVRALLDQTTLPKLRLSSVEPMDWSDDLILLMAASPRIAKHVHMPLQSGSDRILRQMRRKYRPWHYADRIHKCRAAMPDAAIGADVMVGFPGESDALFEESRAFIAALPFTYLHVFTFSARPGTPAAEMPDQVPVHIARERNRILRDLAAEKNLRFRQSFIGRSLPVITLNRTTGAIADAATESLSDNYLKIDLRGHHAPNQWLQARITGLTQDGLRAELL
jgi:threonylcarbamoyladenosine tRNA methylthiotransferase MtaB